MLRPGALFAHRFELIRALGRGGSSSVYLCRDPIRELDVTLKWLEPGAGGELLRAEFALLRRARHGRLTEVLDFGVARGRPYYTARFVDGEPLDGWARGRPWPAVRGAVVDVLAALAHLHRLGVRHGDVKPANVIVAPDGRATLIDLGCAARFGAIDRLAGTPGYLAPELVRGGGDGRADLFAVGVVLGQLAAEVAAAPAEVAALAARLASPRAEDRPVDAGEVLAALDPAAVPARNAILPDLCVGRERELAAADRLIARLGGRGAGPRVLELHGAAGSGRSRLLDEIGVRAAPVLEVVQAAPGRVVAALARLAAATGPVVLLCDDVDRATAAERAALAHQLGALASAGEVGAIVAGASTGEVGAIVAGATSLGLGEALALGPLEPAAVRAWLGELLPAAELASLIDAGAGSPVRLARVATALLDGRATVASAARFAADAPTPGGSLAAGLPAALALAEAGDPAALGALARALAAARRDPGARAAIHAAAGAWFARRGRPARAERELSAALTLPLDPRRRAEVAGQLVVALLKRGEHRAAADRAAVEAQLALEPIDRAELRCGEAVAASYLGELSRARAAADEVRAALPAAPHGRWARVAVRLDGAEAQLAMRSGDAALAIQHYRRAFELARAEALEDLALSAAINYGAACHQQGEWGEALAAYEHGLRWATAQGQTSRRARLRYNLGLLHADLAQPAQAQAALEEVVREAAAADLGFLGGAARLVLAELAVRDRTAAPAAVRARLAAARASLEPIGAARELAELVALEAEWALGEGAGDAAAAIDRAVAAAEASHADDLVARALRLRGRGLVAAARARDAISVLEAALAAAERSGQRHLVAECATALADACLATGSEHLAARHRGRAHEAWERIIASLPEPLQGALRERHLGAAAAPATPRVTATDEGRDLRRLLAINRRLGSAATPADVLRETLDAAIELVGGERGFLLVADGERLTVAVARNLDREQLGRSHGKFSHGIAQEVIRTGEPVVAVDAGGDPRFADNRSVHAMKLKSVLCVPIRGEAGTVGAIYVDNRFRRGGFAERETELGLACADLAAIALDKARLVDALAARGRELERERAEVEALMTRQAAELVSLADELDKSRARTGGSYPEIVGDSPPMRAVFDRLDRVAASDVTVLVRGESGTGKELVARALHGHGPRAAGPFVAINCGALPDALLEAELFGHERGAFTGAVSARPGLLAAASGGTIFLDELGETSPAMQVKLLRVLQEREVRPVGGTKVLPIDVRVVCATNRDLKAEIAAGRFREDLYYRVAVVEIVMPPLRERAEDLVPLSRAILGRIAGELGRPVATLEPLALRRLLQHAWPGNVRELHNVLTKASVLAEGGRIRADDLGLPSAGQVPRGRTPPTRRDLVAALDQHGWHAVRTARALGLSRATLYRWIERHGLERPRGPRARRD